MKLTSKQVVTIIEALRMWQAEARGPMTEDTCTDKEIDDLCERLNTQDVWVVKPGLIEQIGGNVTKLTELQEELRKITHVYIDSVQKKCVHDFKTDTRTMRRSCTICGKVLQ